MTWGIVKAMWRWGMARRISSASFSASSAERFDWQLGQRLRVLHENARRCSPRQEGHRTWGEAAEESAGVAAATPAFCRARDGGLFSGGIVALSHEAPAPNHP